MSRNQRLIPVGVSDFKKIIDKDYAYVDKTLFIEELVEKGIEVALIPRPRRFGKTLNLSMLRYFFEKREQDTSYLFKPFKIWQNAQCRELQGQFPVIFITLKDVKRRTWQETFASLKGAISEAVRPHAYLLKDSMLDDREKELYQAITSERGDQTDYERSLRLLTQWLYRYHNKRVILLIDEYDAPAHAAYMGGFYEELISFLRNWLSSGLKDNPSLEKGVLTGILRIAKESIFSGLNNVTTYTILDKQFQDKFGLTELEVKALLAEYELSDRWDEARKWYNGYRIGSCDGIYNPWSVLNCIEDRGKLAPYWINTSDNALIKELIIRGTNKLKSNFESLLNGEVVEKKIEDGIVFADLQKNPEAICWSLLLYSGYLSLAQTAVYGVPCQLRIPNKEIEEFYRSIIIYWFQGTLQKSDYQTLLHSLTTGDITTFSESFEEFFLSAFSFFDLSERESEKIYHVFVLGVLIGLKDRYEVKSNRESGLGRYDVMLIPKDPQELGVVMEFKTVPHSQTDLESACASALKQIEERQYDIELKNRGVSRILHLGVAFQGKKVLIRSQAPL